MAEQETLPVGYILEGYRIDKVAGRGTFGITYLAHDEDLDVRVAVKEYLPTDTAYRNTGQTVRARSESKAKDFQNGLQGFLAEAKTLAAIDPHPNIVRIIRFFRANGTGYIVMEFIAHDFLDEIVEHGGRLSVERLYDVLDQLSNALRAVHRLGYLHRDIKPANIRVRENGQPVLIDFGAARQTVESRSRPLTTILTPGFAPIEQYSQSDQQGPYTDIYALGATAYSALRGGPPPEASLRRKDDPYEPLAPLATSEMERKVFGAIDWAMKYEETDRPQTVDAWRAQLLTGDAPEAKPASVQPKPAPQASQLSGATVLAGSEAAAPRPRPSRPKRAGGEQSQSSNRTLIIAAVAAVAVLGAGALGAALVSGSSDGTSSSTSTARTAPDLKVTELTAPPDRWMPISPQPLGRDLSAFGLVADQPFRLRIDGETYLIEAGADLPANISLGDPDIVPQVKSAGSGPVEVRLVYR